MNYTRRTFFFKAAKLRYEKQHLSVFRSRILKASIVIGLAGVFCTRAQDAQPKWRFAFGMGSNPPIAGTTGTYQSGRLGFQAGIGRNLNSRFGVQAEYDFNLFGVPDSVLSSTCSACAGGSVDLHSVSFNPYVNLIPEGRVGIYVIGGPGYYWKHTSFYAPTGKEICFTFEGCIPTASTVSRWTTSGFGANGGGGITIRLGSTRMRFFVEGRYVWVRKQNGLTPAYPSANYGLNFISTQTGIRF